MSASTRVDAAEALALLFGEGDVSARVQRTFQLIELAENELRAEERKSKRVKATLRRRGVFKALFPGELAAYGDDVYRSHCREIIARAKRGEDLSPGTDAEVLVMMSRTSLAAPLRPEFAYAMSVVFRRVFSNASEDLRAGAENYDGSAEEIIEEARRKLARDRT